MNSAIEKYHNRAKQKGTVLCVGLDADMGHPNFPEHFKDMEYPQFEFNKFIIEKTHDLVVAYKPNLAFYEARTWKGYRELEMTSHYLREKHPSIFRLADAKRGDIGNTNKGYIKGILDEMDFDGITLHPYMGRESLQLFLDRKDKVCVVLCKTSNSGSGEFQDQPVGMSYELFMNVAENVAKEWNTNGNCMLVVGATYPKMLERVRQKVGQMNILLPGIGAQGGDVEKTVKAGRNLEGLGIMVNSSRGIIFSDNPRQAAQDLLSEINKYR